MPSPQIQFRVSAALNNEIAKRLLPGHSASKMAQDALEWHYEILRRSLPSFSEGEAMLLCDAFNGTIFEPHSVSLLWAGVDDAIQDGLAAKWEVDGPALIERIRRLSYAECVAIADAIEQCWNSPTYQIDNMEERVRKVGLVRE